MKSSTPALPRGPSAEGAFGRKSMATLWPSLFLSLFVMSFALHALGSWRARCDEARLDHLSVPGFFEHLFSSDFWFESMQNWQSEFLAVLALVVLTIFLRQKDSPQSKAVEAPHAQTGD